MGAGVAGTLAQQAPTREAARASGARIRRARAAAGLVGLVLGATLVAPNTASGHTAGDPAADSAAPDPIRTTTVTLVTGDVVQLSTYPDGRQAAAVQRGPASEHGNFQTVERDGHAYVIPDVAAPYLRSGLLDEKLFDVTGLAAQGYTEALPLILEYGTSAASLRRGRLRPAPASCATCPASAPPRSTSGARRRPGSGSRWTTTARRRGSAPGWTATSAGSRWTPR